jgi:ribonuclease P protein component
VNPRAAPRLRFRRAQRLLLATEFALALRARPVEASPHFQLFNPRHERGPRLGIIVGKRFVPHAVDRNRIKRLVRECFRHRRFELPPGDYVVRVRNPVTGMDAPALRAELLGLLKLERGAKSPPSAITLPLTAPV